MLGLQRGCDVAEHVVELLQDDACAGDEERTESACGSTARAARPIQYGHTSHQQGTHLIGVALAVPHRELGVDQLITYGDLEGAGAACRLTLTHGDGTSELL